MLKRRMDDLATWVENYLRKHELTEIELAKKIGYEGNVQVARARKSDGHIPEKRIPDWIEALDLQGIEREEFLKYAHMALATKWLRNWVVAREAELKELRLTNAENTREIKELVAMVATLKERFR